MALQLSLSNSAVGYLFPESYARIVFARTLKDQTFIFVNFYADQAARVADKMPVLQKEYTATTEDLVGDIFPAMYNWLKGQPDFAGCVDVLEAQPAAQVIDFPTQG
jgi:hypothetical protein